jgi:hypothetical protein
MLRLALIENLRRLSIQISNDIANKILANKWADEMIEVAETDPKNLVLTIADMARSKPPIESSFIAEFTRRLQEKGSSLSLPLTWIEQTLSDSGLNSMELIQHENQKQAADQVSISNSISSLRFLSTTDWRDFVETTSVVELTLLKDINGTYEKMDFFTRDSYRHAVEKIAKYSKFSEKEVAEMALQFARENAETTDDPRLTHVGYYLHGKGMLRLQKAVKMRSNKIDTCKKIFNKVPLLNYIGGILLITLLLGYGLIIKVYDDGARSWLLALLFVCISLAASRLAVALINWSSTLLARPFLLPRMNFSKGIPKQYQTMVVIPTVFGNVAGINDLVEALEVRFLANRDVNLQFALLTDFKDADSETLPEDDLLLQTAKTKIIELNQKYERSTNDIFFLFHRPRKWNKKENKWMGYERKRGKLGELNALILGQENAIAAFSTIIGEPSVYTTVKFVITLDTDTQLPRDAAWKMVGTLAHPLNTACFNKKKKRVEDGYTILQPRVSNSLPGSESSLYAKIHGNEPGTDPYTRATSDVYQDLFKEGSFIGKGIYNVAAFEETLEGRFPENSILSHDLVEGCYSRSGLMTDVQLYEEYP